MRLIRTPLIYPCLQPFLQLHYWVIFVSVAGKLKMPFIPFWKSITVVILLKNLHFHNYRNTGQAHAPISETKRSPLCRCMSFFSICKTLRQISPQLLAQWGCLTGSEEHLPSSLPCRYSELSLLFGDSCTCHCRRCELGRKTSKCFAQRKHDEVFRPFFCGLTLLVQHVGLFRV